MAFTSRALKFAATACAAAACLLPIASAQLAGGPRTNTGIILYDQNGFSGEAVQIDGAVPSLSDARFNDKTSSIEVLSGRWEVCTNGNFGGRCEIISNDSLELRGIGLNNNISSVRPVGFRGGRADGPRGGGFSGARDGGIILFRDGDFRGERRAFDDGIRNLSQAGFNDRASSIEVTRGRWLICEHSDFRGRCEIINGSVRNLRDFGLNNNISSLRPARPGDRSTGYDQPRHAGYGGDRPRGGYGHQGGFGNDRGFEGQDTVFFPRPMDRYGERVRNGSGSATRFCRDMGFRGAEYKGNGRYLKDVLCEK